MVQTGSGWGLDPAPTSSGKVKGRGEGRVQMERDSGRVTICICRTLPTTRKSWIRHWPTVFFHNARFIWYKFIIAYSECLLYGLMKTQSYYMDSRIILAPHPPVFIVNRILSYANNRRRSCMRRFYKTRLHICLVITSVVLYLAYNNGLLRRKTPRVGRACIFFAYSTSSRDHACKNVFSSTSSFFLVTCSLTRIVCTCMSRLLLCNVWFGLHTFDFRQTLSVVCLE
jgi:hypothetical protein